MSCGRAVTNEDGPMRSTLLFFGLSGCALFAASATAAASDDRGWRTPRSVEDHVAGNSFSPQIVFDHNGNAMAVWRVADDSSGHIFASHYTAASRLWDDLPS